MAMVEVSTNRSEVAGIPVFWSDLPGPMRASISFRVGYADETLPTSGISHLCEHLSLSALREQQFAYNGFVDATRTSFHASGREDEVVWFLNHVCRALSEPPLERLHKEVKVLETEAQGRASGWLSFHHAMRFGATGWGLSAYRELGLKHADARMVWDWLARFNRGNAAIWMTKPPPEGLELALREGTRSITLPPLPLATTPLPSWVDWNERFVAMSWISDRVPASPALLDIVLKRARSRLRFDEGMSYTVTGAYEPLSATKAHVAVAADCKIEDASTLTEEMIRAIEAIALYGPTQDEINNYVDNTLGRIWEEPTSAIGDLDFAAHTELIGGEQTTRAEIKDTLLQAGPAEFAAAMGAIKDSVLVTIPHATTPPRSFPRIPDFPEPPITHGQIVRGIGANAKNKLVMADDAVSWIQAVGPPATVHLRTCAALLRWDGGRREVIGKDGVSIHIDPALWKKGSQLFNKLDPAVSPDRWVPMGPDLGSNRPSGTPGPGQARTSSHFILSIALIFTAISAILLAALVMDGQFSDYPSLVFPGLVASLCWITLARRRRGG